MKIITLLIILLLGGLYYQSPINYFIPKEFEYPEENIGMGKTFIYENVVTHEHTFTDLKLLNINGKNYQVLKSYTNNSKFDSLIIFNGETIELYDFILLGNANISKGEKLQDTIQKDNNKLGSHITKWRFSTNQFIATESATESYVKDSIITWGKNKLACIITQKNSVIHFQPITPDTSSYNLKFLSMGYYAKGIGLFKYSTDFIDHDGNYNSNTHILKDIQEIR